MVLSLIHTLHGMYTDMCIASSQGLLYWIELSYCGVFGREEVNPKFELHSSTPSPGPPLHNMLLFSVLLLLPLLAAVNVNHRVDLGTLEELLELRS